MRDENATDPAIDEIAKRQKFCGQISISLSQNSIVAWPFLLSTSPFFFGDFNRLSVISQVECDISSLRVISQA